MQTRRRPAAHAARRASAAVWNSPPSSRSPKPEDADLQAARAEALPSRCAPRVRGRRPARSGAPPLPALLDVDLDRRARRRNIQVERVARFLARRVLGAGLVRIEV